MKLDKAFPGMPASFEDAMREGIRKGKQKMKLKNKIKIASVAAALALCVLAAAFAAGNGGAPDDTVTASPTPDISVKTVYITQHGAFYHSEPDCQGMQNAVTVRRNSWPHICNFNFTGGDADGILFQSGQNGDLRVHPQAG